MLRKVAHKISKPIINGCYTTQATLNVDIKSKQDLSDYIINFFKQNGDVFYDEEITQIQHAFQTMFYAKNMNATQEMQLACFLHDIGHILIDEQQFSDWQTKDYNHETIGFQFCNKYFPHSVSVPVCLHVKAKKYLCSVDETYHDKLSESSKNTLKLQGGLMNNDEIKRFESNEYFKDAINLRIWEDESKVLNEVITDDYTEIDYFIKKYATLE